MNFFHMHQSSRIQCQDLQIFLEVLSDLKSKKDNIFSKTSTGKSSILVILYCFKESNDISIVSCIVDIWVCDQNFFLDNLKIYLWLFTSSCDIFFTVNMFVLYLQYLYFFLQICKKVFFVLTFVYMLLSYQISFRILSCHKKTSLKKNKTIWRYRVIMSDVRVININIFSNGL